MEQERDAAWEEFAATGRIDAYLRYHALSEYHHTGEEEPAWASSVWKESLQGKSNTETPHGF